MILRGKGGREKKGVNREVKAASVEGVDLLDWCHFEKFDGKKTINREAEREEKTSKKL